MSIPAETPAAVIDLAVLDEAAADRVGAELAQLLEEEPVAGRPLALEQAGGAEHQRAGADRGRPLACRASIRRSQESTASSSSSGRLPSPPGTRTMSASVDLVERVVGAEAERAAVGAHLALLGADELDLPAGDGAQHLVGADRVEGGELVEDEDGDLHAPDRRVARMRRAVRLSPRSPAAGCSRMRSVGGDAAGRRRRSPAPRSSGRTGPRVQVRPTAGLAPAAASETSATLQADALAQRSQQRPAPASRARPISCR